MENSIGERRSISQHDLNHALSELTSLTERYQHEVEALFNLRNEIDKKNKEVEELFQRRRGMIINQLDLLEGYADSSKEPNASGAVSLKNR